MSTRAVEVAPGVFVAPEDYTGAVKLVCSSCGDKSDCVIEGPEICHTIVGTTAAEVAAKLWPVENVSSLTVALERVLDMATAMLARNEAKKGLANVVEDLYTILDSEVTP